MKKIDQKSLIMNVIKYLVKYPIPLNIDCMWMIEDNSKKDTEIFVYRGFGLDIISHLFTEERLVSWKYKGTSDHLHFIGFDGNTIIEPLKEGDAFFYSCTVEVTATGLKIPEIFMPHHNNNLDCISDERGFMSYAGLTGVKVTEEIIEKLFPVKIVNDYLTGTQLAKLLLVNPETYDHFLDGEHDGLYDHLERLFTSPEMTGVPFTTRHYKDACRSGDVCVSENGKFYLYVGRIEKYEDGSQVYYDVLCALESSDELGTLAVTILKTDDDEMKLILSNIFFSPHN